MACELIQDFFSNLRNYQAESRYLLKFSNCHVLRHTDLYQMHHICLMCSLQLYDNLVKSDRISEASDRHTQLKTILRRCCVVDSKNIRRVSTVYHLT